MSRRERERLALQEIVLRWLDEERIGGGYVEITASGRNGRGFQGRPPGCTFVETLDAVTALEERGLAVIVGRFNDGKMYEVATRQSLSRWVQEIEAALASRSAPPIGMSLAALHNPDVQRREATVLLREIQTYLARLR